MFRYLVTSPGGRQLIVEAKDGQQAKRKACKTWGIRSTDYWTGVPSLKVRKMKGDEPNG